MTAKEFISQRFIIQGQIKLFNEKIEKLREKVKIPHESWLTPATYYDLKPLTVYYGKNQDGWYWGIVQDVRNRVSFMGEDGCVYPIDSVFVEKK